MGQRIWGFRNPRSALLSVAALLFALVFAFRIAVNDPAEPILFFLLVPIGIVAAEFGLRGGMIAAAFGALLVLGWDLTTAADLTVYGYVSRVALFLLSGITIGSLTTRRKELEAESSRWFEQSPDLNCVLDLEGNFIRLNRAWERSLGYPIERLLETPYIALVHPDDIERTHSLATGIAKGQEDVAGFENRYRRADGSYLWLRWTSTTDPVRGCIYATAHDVTRMKQQEGELRDLAHTDQLTGLPNRRHFEEEASRQLDFIRRYGSKAALFVLDIDRFKSINDTLGHQAGDEALKKVADVIKRRVRKTDVAARIGGDEFAILLPEVGRKEAELLGHAILRLISDVSGETHITSSLGIALFVVGDDAGLDTLMAGADDAMYEAKRGGGGRMAFAVQLDSLSPQPATSPGAQAKESPPPSAQM
jgi:diguanylate cyclase (GGDEF)-like protein/PAS domain S-box-containing protein